MEVGLAHDGARPGLELAAVAGRQHKQVLPLVFLLFLDFLYLLLNTLRQLRQHWEVWQDSDKDDQTVPDLDVVLGLQTHDYSLNRIYKYILLSTLDSFTFSHLEIKNNLICCSLSSTSTSAKSLIHPSIGTSLTLSVNATIRIWKQQIKNIITHRQAAEIIKN